MYSCCKRGKRTMFVEFTAFVHKNTYFFSSVRKSFTPRVCVCVYLNTFSFFSYQIAYSKCYSYIYIFIITRILIVLMTNTKWQQMKKKTGKTATHTSYTFEFVCAQCAGKNTWKKSTFQSTSRRTQIQQNHFKIAIGHAVVYCCAH